MKKAKTEPLPEVETLYDEELPEGWKSIVLKDHIYIAARIGWRGLKREEYTKEGPLFLAVKDIQENGFIDFQNVTDHLSEYRYDESPEIQLKEEDIIITKDGTIGKIGFAKDLPSKVTVNSSLLVVRPSSEILPRFLFFYFRSSNFQKIVRERITGSAVPHLFQKDIKKFRILVPPLAEQQRIVNRVEALLTQVNAASERLNQVPVIMKKFRQAVLAAACSGRLTEGWREIHQGNINNTKKVENIRNIDTDLNVNFELPDSWIWTNLESVCEIKSGNAFSSKDFRNTGVNAVKISNIGYGDFLWKNQEFLPENFLEKFSDFLVYPSDLLIALTRPITNDTVKICLYPEDAPIGLLNQRVAMIKPSTKYEKNLLLFYLQSNLFKEQILFGIAETLQPNLSPVKMGKFVVPLPPLAEQHEIVRCIGLLFERADTIDHEVAAAGRRCERLTQAVLGKAFRGELVAPGKAEGEA
jgi:type I restriction enzyme S subunit